MRLLVAALAGLAASAAANPIANGLEESNLEPRAKCVSGVRIIAGSGHGGAIRDGYGLLDTTVASILAAIPDSSNFSVPYPKRSEDFPTAIAIAAAHMNNSITKYAAKCPDTAIVLLGYSEGGQAVMNALCGRSHIGAPYGPPLVNSSYIPNIAAVVTYGEETRVPGQPYNLGTCRKGQGVNPRGNPAGCDNFAPVIESYCDKTDPQCCGGKNQSQHYVYPKKYNDVATQFIVDQWYNHTQMIKSKSKSTN